MCEGGREGGVREADSLSVFWSSGVDSVAKAAASHASRDHLRDACGFTPPVRLAAIVTQTATSPETAEMAPKNQIIRNRIHTTVAAPGSMSEAPVERAPVERACTTQQQHLHGAASLASAMADKLQQAQPAISFP